MRLHPTHVVPVTVRSKTTEGLIQAALRGRTGCLQGSEVSLSVADPVILYRECSDPSSTRFMVFGIIRRRRTLHTAEYWKGHDLTDMVAVNTLVWRAADPTVGSSNAGVKTSHSETVGT